jgi:acetylornithine/succinyldiaminopimelate/putrescine aminotransferase
MRQQLKESRLGAKKRYQRIESSRVSRDQVSALSGLDVQFTAAQGDYVYWQDDQGNGRRAVDLAGGAGALLLGHNHPKIVSVALRHLHDRRPVAMQGAGHGPVEALKLQLADRIGRETNREYEVLLLDTSADAMQTALSHAQLEFQERQKVARAGILSKLQRWRERIEQGFWAPEDAFFRECERILGAQPLESIDNVEQAIIAKNAPVLDHPGHVLAPVGRSRGKAVEAPHSPSNDLEGGSSETIQFLYEPDLDRFTIARIPFCTIASILLEPIRAQDGIYEVHEDVTRDVLNFRSNHPEVPVIVNETETGLGRTGRFLEGAARGLPCDYVTLGRAMGGGVAKLAAVAIERKRYLPEYSVLHAASFANDEYSSVVGAACLETIDVDRICERCEETGSNMQAALLSIARHWPAQIVEIRGRGLMLAVEFEEQSANRSAVLRALDAENLFSAVVAGFLLHRHDIRILPAAGCERVLRFEPSAYLQRAEVQRVAHALNEVCSISEAGDAFSLLAHLVRGEAYWERVEIVGQAPFGAKKESPLPRRSGVGYIGQFLDGDHWSDDPALRRFSPDELTAVLEILSVVLPAKPIAETAQSFES